MLHSEGKNQVEDFSKTKSLHKTPFLFMQEKGVLFSPGRRPTLCIDGY